jgi:hypothetical protein
MTVLRNVGAFVGVGTLLLLTSRCDSIIGDFSAGALLEASVDGGSGREAGGPPVDSGTGTQADASADASAEAAPACSGQACSQGCLGDEHNCGACGNVCTSPLPLCSGGQCSSSCGGADPNLCGSTCTNTQTDSANCGSCGTACMGGMQCSTGNCGCPSNTHVCSNACVSNSSASSCGTTSCTPCPAPASGGTATCNSDGSCGVSCDPSTPSYCSTSNTCVNTANDPNNCGGCGVVCGSSTPVCSNGCQPPPTWCTTQSPPAGVAAADFQCLDFDGTPALPPSSTWVQATSGATLAVSGALFDSSANSLSVSAPATSSATEVATLTWTGVGSTAITSITASAEVNPPVPGVSPAWTGAVELLCVLFNQTGQVGSFGCIEFEYGSPSVLKVHWATDGMVQSFCTLPNLWNNSAWNSLELSETSGGAIVATVNGTATDCSAVAPGTSTSGSVAIGAQAFATTTYTWTGYIDNVIGYVSR